MNPATTMGLMAGGVGGAPLVQYIAQIAHMPPMSDVVAGLIATIIAGGVHTLWTFINTRFPAKTAPVVAPVPAAPPAA